ncbi:MAG TPA: hypothetical protein VF385_03080 [Patescibacteria group bacterium]
MPGEFNCLEKDEWKELIDRHVHKSGNVYAGKEVPLQKIWLFYKTSEKHHKWDIYMP